MVPLTIEELKSYQDTKVSHICRKIILEKLSKSMTSQKVRDHCHYTGKYRSAAYSICKLTINVLKEIPAVFHKGSNSDHHFVIK